MAHLRDLQKLRETKNGGFTKPSYHTNQMRTTQTDKIKP